MPAWAEVSHNPIVQGPQQVAHAAWIPYLCCGVHISFSFCTLQSTLSPTLAPGRSTFVSFSLICTVAFPLASTPITVPGPSGGSGVWAHARVATVHTTTTADRKSTR